MKVNNKNNIKKYSISTLSKIIRNKYFSNLNNNSIMIMGFISYGSKEEACQHASDLVEKDYVACAKVLPGIKSFYKWEGKLESSEEVYLIIKSLKEKIPEIKEYLNTKHSYDVYEFIYTEATSANEDYYKWVKQMLGSKI